MLLATILLLAALFSRYSTHAQNTDRKPRLDVEQLKAWPQIASWQLNTRGTHVFYQTKNEIAKESRIHLQNLNSGEEEVYAGAQSPRFSEDGKFFFLLLPDKQLLVKDLPAGNHERITNITDYELFSSERNNILICRRPGNLVLFKDLRTGKNLEYSNCYAYKMSTAAPICALFQREGKTEKLSYVNFSTEQIYSIMETDTASFQPYTCAIDQSNQIVFQTKPINAGTEIWYYFLRSGKLQKIIDEDEGFSNKHYSLTGELCFLAGGKSVLFSFRKNMPKPDKTKASVNVYTYLDAVPYTQQSQTDFIRVVPKEEFFSIFNLDENKIAYTDAADENLAILSEFSDRVGVVRKEQTVVQRTGDFSWYFISTITGKKLQINIPEKTAIISISPEGKFLILQQLNQTKPGNIYSYNSSVGSYVNLTNKLPIRKDTEFENKGSQSRFKVEAFIEGTDQAIVGDNYDLWLISLSQGGSAECLTNGYGKKNRIVLQVSSANFVKGLRGNKLIPKERLNNLILTSYNYLKSDNDFYRLRYRKNPVLERCTFGGYMFERVDINGNAHRAAEQVLSADSLRLFLVQRQNASEFPNLFLTADFKNFKQITHFNPERGFNWLTSQIVSFQSRNGKPMKGVLYKPQDFDQQKKYPIIFYYYEKMTQDAFQYKTPTLSSAVINIPYYVSNGYLVFTPDIYEDRGKGNALHCAFESVMGAADALSKFLFVDSTKMAVHGHSWGGYETNYILTHTGRFAAAMVGAGGSDAVGGFALPTHYGRPVYNPSFYDAGGQLSFNRDVYIKNSPKMFANKVTTPVLFMHNEKDGAVLFMHSLSFFYSLAALNKKAWLLSYDGEGHIISNEVNRLDFTIRMKQFFDHYLVGKPAPLWMTKGIPYILKQVESRYEYDSNPTTLPTSE